MNFANYQSQMQKLIAHRNGFLSLAAVLAVICMLQLLLIASLSRREHVILLSPALHGTSWVAGSQADPDYISSMSRYFVGLMLNVTPENAPMQHKEALTMVAPPSYTALKSRLVEESDQLKQKHASTTFDIRQIAVDSKHHRALVKGDLSTYIGQARTSKQKLVYQITYQIQNGRWWVRSFKEAAP